MTSGSTFASSILSISGIPADHAVSGWFAFGGAGGGADSVSRAKPVAHTPKSADTPTANVATRNWIFL